MNLKYKTPLILAIFCFYLTSCSLTPGKLQLAERLLETKPNSALSVLEHIQNVNKMSDENKAFYGLLLFEALDKNNKTLQPDSIIKFSINYYSTHNDNPHLAASYYYNAKILKYSQRFDDATLLYLKALDVLQSKKENYLLLGKIYSDMGDICAIQMDYTESLRKFQESISYFNKAENKVEASYRIIAIGRVYRFLKRYKNAQHYYQLVLSQTSNSLVLGSVFQEIGLNYYWAKQYDSAQYFLRKSLHFPYKGTNYAIRCVNMADLMFDIEKPDSAKKYALLSLKYPANYYNRRDCYRILANSEYAQNNLKQMAVYMGKYQACTDSVRIVEMQTKSTVLENLHDSAKETAKTKRNTIWIVVIMTIIISIALSLLYFIYQRSRSGKKQLTIYKQELSQKQQFVNQNLAKRIQENRLLQAEKRKEASPEERLVLDKDLYDKCLHLSNWDDFSNEMNHAFNDIVHTLQTDFSGITQKEIIWCCLHLLDIPNADRLSILSISADSMYKLKQRLAQKMSLKSTKELDAFLKKLSIAQI